MAARNQRQRTSLGVVSLADETGTRWAIKARRWTSQMRYVHEGHRPPQLSTLQLRHSLSRLSLAITTFTVRDSCVGGQLPRCASRGGGPRPHCFCCIMWRFE